MLLGGTAAYGYEKVPTAVEIDKLPRFSEPAPTFWEHLRERTEIGVGFDEVYNNNILLEDNNNKEDYITTLESVILYADPKGSLLYGFQYEVNAFRYHKINANAIDHDFLAFVDLDPGSRFKYRLHYILDVSNRLTFGPEEIDLLRRSTDFQRSVEHTWIGKLKYALNDTNAFSSQVKYSLLDDQVVNDAETDRQQWATILDLDHALTPAWTVFTGYEFGVTHIPGNTPKDSESHLLRLGSGYELTDLIDLDVVFKVGRKEFDDGKQDTQFGFGIDWTHEIGPRTTVKLGFTDEQVTSFAAGRRQFRSTRPTLGIDYALTPLVKWSGDLSFEKQESGGEDALAGNSPTSTKSSRYQLKTGFLWQVREQAHVTLDYRLVRSKTSDYTNQIVGLGFEMEI